MNRRKVGVILIGAGVILALTVGIVVYMEVSESEQLRAAQAKRWVAVASTDIPERSVIAGEQVILVQVPDAVVPPGAASYLPEGGTSGEEVESRKQGLVGRVRDQFTPTRIFKGEVINTERLGREAGKNTPSYDLPAGKVAYVFPMKVNGGSPATERLHLAYLNAIRPGDFVDIYFSAIEIPPGLTEAQEEKARSTAAASYLRTRSMMQNLKVINVGYFAETAGRSSDTPRDERFLTFEVTPDQALELKWLKDVAVLVGNLEIVLRSPLDTQPYPQAEVNFELMSRNFGFAAGR
jgi:Flp pilus assembly protein CpaB